MKFYHNCDKVANQPHYLPGNAMCLLYHAYLDCLAFNYVDNSKKFTVIYLYSQKLGLIFSNEKENVFPETTYSKWSLTRILQLPNYNSYMS